MVLLGRPKNGDIIRAQLRVKESKEFKVSWKHLFKGLCDYLHARYWNLERSCKFQMLWILSSIFLSEKRKKCWNWNELKVSQPSFEYISHHRSDLNFIKIYKFPSLKHKFISVIAFTYAARYKKKIIVSCLPRSSTGKHADVNVFFGWIAFSCDFRSNRYRKT